MEEKGIAEGGGGGKRRLFLIQFTLRQILTSVHLGWQAFSKIGPLISAVIAKKKDPKTPGKFNKAQKLILWENKFLKCSCACKFQYQFPDLLLRCVSLQGQR